MCACLIQMNTHYTIYTIQYTLYVYIQNKMSQNKIEVEKWVVAVNKDWVEVRLGFLILVLTSLNFSCRIFLWNFVASYPGIAIHIVQCILYNVHYTLSAVKKQLYCITTQTAKHNLYESWLKSKTSICE